MRLLFTLVKAKQDFCSDVEMRKEILFRRTCELLVQIQPYAPQVFNPQGVARRYVYRHLLVLEGL